MQSKRKSSESTKKSESRCRPKAEPAEPIWQFAAPSSAQQATKNIDEKGTKNKTNTQNADRYAATLIEFYSRFFYVFLFVQQIKLFSM